MRETVFISIEGEPVDLKKVSIEGDMYSASELVQQYNSSRISVFNLSQWLKRKKIQAINSKSISEKGVPAIKIKLGRHGSTFVDFRIFSELLAELKIDYDVSDLIQTNIVDDLDFHKKALYGSMLINGKDRKKTMVDIDFLDRILSVSSNIEDVKFGYFMFENIEYSTALSKLKSRFIDGVVF